MNARQRVLQAVDGQEIWPVPTDVTGNLIHSELEDRLKQQLKTPDREGLFRTLGAHLRWANPRYIGPAVEKAPVQPPSAFAVRCRGRGHGFCLRPAFNRQPRRRR